MIVEACFHPILYHGHGDGLPDDGIVLGLFLLGWQCHEWGDQAVAVGICREEEQGGLEQRLGHFQSINDRELRSLLEKPTKSLF